MIDEFTRQAVAQSLKKMFEGSYFDICTIDRCLEAMKVHPVGNQYEALRPLHCVHWSDMEPAFRRQVFDRVMAMFDDAEGFNIVAIDARMGTSAHQAVIDAPDWPSKRKAAGLLPFHRRA